MEPDPKQFRNPKPSSLCRALSSSLSNLFLAFVFLIPCFSVLFRTTLTHAAGESRLEKTLLLTYAPDCSPKNNIAERALRKSLALSIEKKTGSTLARINEGAYEGPELPMSTRIVGDYEAYSAKVITLDAVKFTESANDFFHPFSQPVTTVAPAATANGSAVGCTVSEESLKRVGVDVLQLVACPLVSVEDVKQALAVDPCVASVEVDQELTVDVFGTEKIQSDANEKPQFFEREKWVESDGRALSSSRSYTGDADTWTLGDQNGRDGKPHAALSQRGDRAATKDGETVEHEGHPYKTRNPSLRAKSVGSSTVEIRKSTVYQANAKAWKGESSSDQEKTRRGGGVSAEAGGTTLANTSPQSAAFTIEDASAAPYAIAAAGASAGADASAVVESFFPEHDSLAQGSNMMTASYMEQPVGSRSFAAEPQGPLQLGSSAPSVFTDKQIRAEHGTSPLSLDITAAPGASTAGAASRRKDLGGISEFPASIEQLLLFHASTSSPKREEMGPKHVHVTEPQPQSFTCASQRFQPLHERTAVAAQTEGAPAEEAEGAVAFAASATAGASVAEKETPTAAEQQRPYPPHVPLHARERDELNVSYWRTKSGFHTRAYELASCEKNRVIAVIDTGIAYSHPALVANVWVNEGEIPDNDIDDDKNGFVDDVYGYNFRDNSGDPMDDHGHGTHVAGIIGALEDASDHVLPAIRKRRRSVRDKYYRDETQRERGEQRLEQEGQHVAEEQDEGPDEEEQPLRDGQRERREGEAQLHGKVNQGQNQQRKPQQERELQWRPKKNRDSRQWEDPNPGWRRNWRVRAQQGVCGETSIAGLKFMGATGNGATSDAIKALNYAVQMNMKLSCNSWGGPSWSEALVSALEAADENGHLFIAAAGNQGKNTDEIPHYPASYQLPNVISVAATNIDDELAPFSNRGAKTVDVAAPGVKIRSTFPPDRFKELSGTSMATPVVAGLAAMLMSLPYDNTKQIKDAIIKGVDKIPSVAGLVKSGGRINAEKSVAWLVNELDLDVDFMVQKKQLKFALPHFYALYDDTVEDLAVAQIWGSGGSDEDEAKHLRVEEGGRGPKAVAGTHKEGKQAQAGGKELDPQHGKSGSDPRRKATVISETSGEKRDIEQVEDLSIDAEKSDAVPRFLQGKCVSNCSSPASI